jgi:XTP/dITP diphosphohydrolase
MLKFLSWIMKEILFATGNKGKLEEMKPPFREKGFELKQVEVDVPEIDAMDVEEVAEQKVRDSFEAAVEKDLVESNEMIIVEDTGFFIESLGGFPGAEAAFLARTAGVENLIPMMEGEADRSAYFKTAIAVYIPEEDRVEIFSGKLEGEVPENRRGDSHPHLPYNSYFIPDHGEGSSLAENEDLKNQEMHRRKAVNNLLGWLTE